MPTILNKALRARCKQSGTAVFELTAVCVRLWPQKHSPSPVSRPPAAVSPPPLSQRHVAEVCTASPVPESVTVLHSSARVDSGKPGRPYG